MHAPVSFALVALVLVLGACGATMPPSYARNPLSPNGTETKPLPAIKRPTVDGHSFDTAAARGKVTVVKFFAKYCEPCKTSLPWFERFARDNPDVVVVGIAEDERESDVREIIQTFGLTFPVVHDGGNALSGRFRVTEMPITFVADPLGRIRWVGGPGQTEADLSAAVSASSSAQ
jgi:thiol-disulfide isomerase/thioredoxin